MGLPQLGFIWKSLTRVLQLASLPTTSDAKALCTSMTFSSHDGGVPKSPRLRLIALTAALLQPLAPAISQCQGVRRQPYPGFVHAVTLRDWAPALQPKFCLEVWMKQRLRADEGSFLEHYTPHLRAAGRFTCADPSRNSKRFTAAPSWPHSPGYSDNHPSGRRLCQLGPQAPSKLKYSNPPAHTTRNLPQRLSRSSTGSLAMPLAER